MVGPVHEKLVKKSVHQHKLLSKKGILERMFSFWFDSLVYNQIWKTRASTWKRCSSTPTAAC